MIQIAEGHERLAALRLYFPSASRANKTSLWHHLSPPALAQHLLNVARHARIEQVMLHHIHAGHESGQRMSHHHPETHDMRHPQCLELVDQEATLRRFLHDHAVELRKVRAVLFLCELPIEETRG